ncbi:MAG: electron transport complex subunit RsxC [Clostridia bacterium]|nr:electron transport complex subunit RsxC [Clostridia bacterium]
MALLKGKFFRRGVHAADMKYLAKNQPIEEASVPDEVCISLSQHIGKPAVPIVAVGDEVKQGQKIADADGFISAPIFSSVSGKVKSIDFKTEERGSIAQYITIENDGRYEFMPLSGEVDVNDAAAVKQRIIDAGIVGLGGAAFPTGVKLSPKTPVDTLIINGAECEPYLTCDYRLLIEKTEEVYKGIQLLKTALGVSKVLVGIEKNKPDAIEIFAKYSDLDVVALKERYPMGGEKQLIYCTTGRKVPCGKLPADVGCVVQNVSTAYAVYEAVVKNKALFERVLTVSGGAVREPKNLLVKNGTSYEYIFDLCGGIDEEKLGMLIDGGPMMGYSAISTSFYTKKATSGLLALAKKEVSLEEPTPCLSCGRCSAACPMNLMPMDIDFYTQAGEYEKARDLGGVLNCIECGSCAYVCPARRAIVQSVTMAKAKLRQMKR